MKRIATYLFALLALWRVPADVSAQTGSEALSPLDDGHRVRINEALIILKTVGDSIWADWSAIETPILLVEEDVEYLMMHPKPPQDFIKVGEDDLLGPILARKRQNRVNLAASYPLFGLYPAVLIGTPKNLGGNSATWVRTLLHELFHVYQMHHGEFQKTASLELGPKEQAMWQLNFPFPYGEETVRMMNHQLALALARGLIAAPGKALNHACKDWVELRKVYFELLRLMSGNDKNYRYAKFQEWKEGAARYTEWALAKALHQNQYDPSPAFKALPDYTPLVPPNPQVEPAVADLLQKCCATSSRRTDFYLLGGAQALLLDRMGTAWKKRYFDLSHWLDDALADAATAEAAQSFTLALPDFQGETFNLAEQPARPRLLFFFSCAKWAKPAHRMVPVVNKIAQTYTQTPLEVIGIALKTQADEVVPFIDKKGIPYRVLNGTGRTPLHNHPSLEALELNGVPAFVLLDSQNRIVYRRNQAVSDKELTQQIDAILAK